MSSAAYRARPPVFYLRSYGLSGGNTVCIQVCLNDEGLINDSSKLSMAPKAVLSSVRQC